MRSRHAERYASPTPGYVSGVAAMFMVYLVLIVAGIALYTIAGLAHW
jgi:hypothetical protein